MPDKRSEPECFWGAELLSWQASEKPGPQFGLNSELICCCNAHLSYWWTSNTGAPIEVVRFGLSERTSDASCEGRKLGQPRRRFALEVCCWLWLFAAQLLACWLLLIVNLCTLVTLVRAPWSSSSVCCLCSTNLSLEGAAHATWSDLIRLTRIQRAHKQPPTSDPRLRRAIEIARFPKIPALVSIIVVGILAKKGHSDRWIHKLGYFCLQNASSVRIHIIWYSIN